MPNSVRICRCVTLHTYPAVVTADSWHMVTHICHCGREHFSEEILPAEPSPKRGPKRPTPSAPRQKRRHSTRKSR